MLVLILHLLLDSLNLELIMFLKLVLKTTIFYENIFPSLEKEKLVLKHDKKLFGIIQSYLILIQGQINVNLKFKR
jgi:hypothetical protein